MVLGLGGCVVTADGLFVPPSRMTTAELRAELSGAGIEVPASATGGSSSSTRSQLLKLVKVGMGVAQRRAVRGAE